MKPIWQRRILVIVIAICTVPAVYEIWKQSSKVGSATELISYYRGTRTSNSDLKLTRPADFSNETDFQCVGARFQNLSFPMCVYKPGEDKFISNAVIHGGYTDHLMVSQFMKFLQKHRDVTFVDLGANLGIFTLPMAHLDIHVVAAEPSWDTFRRLAKGIHLGKVGHKIDLLNYAIGDVKSNSLMKFDPTNRADTYISDNVSCAGNCVKVSTTTLNEITHLIKNKKAVFKVDTQGTEIQIFTESAANKFFDEVDVSFVLVEWVLYPQRYSGTQERRAMVDRWLQFFYKRNYTVYHPVNEHKLGPDWRGWSYDVMFKKSGLPEKPLFSI